MSIIIQRFEKIKENISKSKRNTKPNIIAVSKTFDFDYIKPLILHGHNHFGENKVQEAEKKWSDVRVKNHNLKLHMVGRLQSNKAKKAVEVFDYIHSLDNEKLAKVISSHEKKINKKLKYFIQVNIGDESQKSGVAVKDLNNFYMLCVKELELNIIGLMIIPPNDNNTEKYFEKINKLNTSLNLKELSMGMSQDYHLALKHNATFIRIGSAIFGERS
ncbi:pyridoxal phosphate biosynthesis protein [SAR11 cluster bacterium PRT-SC02]|nr:pyridoxal phosphate biosynthesis protein [SAR11 cluster bacterium PRT-SC02]